MGSQVKPSVFLRYTYPHVFFELLDTALNVLWRYQSLFLLISVMPPDSFAVVTHHATEDGEDEEVIVRDCSPHDPRISHFFPDDR